MKLLLLPSKVLAQVMRYQRRKRIPQTLLPQGVSVLSYCRRMPLLTRFLFSIYQAGGYRVRKSPHFCPNLTIDAVCTNDEISIVASSIFCANTYTFLDSLDGDNSLACMNPGLVPETVVKDVEELLAFQERNGVTKTIVN